MALFLVYSNLVQQYDSTQGYSPMDSAREMLRNTVWLGQGNEVADSFTENDVTRLIYRVGWLPFFAMLAAVAGFYAYLLKQCIRQRSMLGRSLSLMGWAALLIPTALGVLNAIGLMPNAFDAVSYTHLGDYVVHDIHGKGKYLGLKTLEAGGNVAEYMELEYRGGDKLYIPTAQIDRVQKYIGSEDAPPQLSKLGGKEWETAKTKARESALKLAFDLVDLYAQRFETKGHAFSEDTVWQKQFEDAFEYEETEGQLESVEQIKKDMESPKVMDRLLLGDVGYGKTEVAMRAAMKAVMDRCV